MSTHNLCFEEKFEKYQNFLSENFHLLVVNFSVYLNRLVFIMGVRAIKVRLYMLSWRNTTFVKVISCAMVFGYCRMYR